jgi:hypothetical protein
LSPTIDAVIATALEKNPDARFQNAKALSRALRQACDALAEVTDDPLGATQINMAAVRIEPSTAVPAWDDTVLRTVERQFAHYVGPMARVMIRRAAEQTTDVDELYTMLAENITDPVRRQRFFDEGSATASAARGARQPGSTTGTRARAHAAVLEQTFTTRRCAWDGFPNHRASGRRTRTQKVVQLRDAQQSGRRVIRSADRGPFPSLTFHHQGADNAAQCLAAAPQRHAASQCADGPRLRDAGWRHGQHDREHRHAA